MDMHSAIGIGNIKSSSIKGNIVALVINDLFKGSKQGLLFPAIFTE
jgi:hypothetical protein